MTPSLQSELRALRVWRDSVHPGDDFDAPHEIEIEITSSASVSSVLQQILEMSYLAGISGGKATWILQAERAVAVIAQQWSKPRYLVAEDTEISSLVSSSGKCHLEFRYWCQVDPDIVFECLRDGRPLPNKYGAT